MTASGSTCCSTAHYVLPHIHRGIYTHILALGFDSVGQFRHEVTVTGCIVARPRTASAGICFNIQPNLPVQTSRYSIHHLCYLCRRSLSSTGEHVNIGLDACCFGALQSSHSMSIDTTIRTKTSDDDEAHAVFLEAIVGRC
jgi:hypothetical protein